MASLAQVVRGGATFSALRHGNFRMYFAGQLVSQAGIWMQTIAQGWLVFQLTRSELALGLVACAAGISPLLLSPFAGVVVDRFPRRRLLLMTQTAQMTLTFLLTALILTEVIEVWHIIVAAFASGTINSLDAPSRQAFIKDMVGREDLSSAVTVNSMMMNGARVVGPGVAGMLLATLGAGWCFFVNGVCFMFALTVLTILKVPNPVPGVGRGSPIQQMRDGIRYSRQNTTILPLLLLSSVASVFAVNMMTLLPAYADRVLNMPVDGLSRLTMAQGIGALCGATLLAMLVNRFGRGRVAIMMLMVLSAALILLAYSNALALSSLWVGVVGFCMTIFYININCMIQNEVPDAFRGRVLALYTFTWLGLTPLGALAIGWIANVIGTPHALALYGLLNGVLGLAIVLRWRGVERIP
jgi:MFS family permease